MPHRQEEYEVLHLWVEALRIKPTDLYALPDVINLRGAFLIVILILKILPQIIFDFLKHILNLRK